MSIYSNKDSTLISSTSFLKQSTSPFGASTIANNSLNTNIVTTKPKTEAQTPIDLTINQFTYFKPSNEGYFKFKIDSEVQSFNSLKHKYFLIFCITIQNDSPSHLSNLKLTIEAIFNNLKTLTDVNITENKILICLNIQRITKEQNLFSLYLHNGNESYIKEQTDLKNIYMNLEYDEYLGIKSYCSINEDFSNCIDCFFFTKSTIFTQIEIFKLFAKSICYKIMEGNEHITYSCFLHAGVMPLDFSIKKLILSLYETPKQNNAYQNICSIPSLETIPTGIFSKIQQYEYIHYNIYDLHYYNMTCSIPINSQCCLFKLTKGLVNQLILFYISKINIDASVYYHDNLLGVYLFQLGYKINYVPSIEAHKQQTDLTITDVMYNYSLKLQGHLLINYNLLTSELTSCLNCNFLQKILLCFHLIGSIFEFTFPCFCMLIIYSIYYEGFGLRDDNPNASIFFTGLYVILTVIFICISLTNPNPNGSYKLFLVIYCINEIYTLLTLIISIIGMHYVRINKHNTLYKFNVAAIVCFIIFNFIFGIVPMILNVKKVIENIVNMLLYLVMGTANYTSLFLVHGICNMADSYGREELITTNNYLYEIIKVSEYQEHRNKKGIIIICYIIVNSFLGFFVLLLKTRKKRIHCVIALSVIFTIYNGVKMFAIIWSKLVVTKQVENMLNDNNIFLETKALFLKETDNEEVHDNNNEYEKKDEMNQNDTSENEYNISNHNEEEEQIDKVEEKVNADNDVDYY